MDPLIQTRQSLLGRLKDWDDDKSWRDFFETYWRIIYSYARKAGLSESEAEEVVQDTVLSVAKEMQRLKYNPTTGSFKGYLKQITRRRIVDKFRKRPKNEERLPPNETSVGGVSPLEKLPDVAADQQADTAWEKEWRQNLMERALEIVRAQISPRQYQVFDLYVLRQMSVREVARIMGINIAQVYLAKSRVSALAAKEVRRLEKTLF